MQILIPIASRTRFFPESDYFFPKPLIDVAEKAMIERVINSLKDQFKNPKFIFIVDSADCTRFSLDKLLKILGGEDSKVIQKNSETAGALCSALLTIDHLDLNKPLLISNCDTLISGDISKEISTLTNDQNTAAVFTFKSIHPQWSYVRHSQDNKIDQVHEKEVVSNNALVGLYFFKTAKKFFNAAKEAILSDASVNGSFFISSTINQIILTGGEASFYELNEQNIHILYSPEAIQRYTDQYLDSAYENNKNLNIVIPAAGLGSRFAKEGWNKPKPFIDVCGKSMLAQVMNNLYSDSANFIILTRNEYIENYPKDVSELSNEGAKILSVPNLTEGTACTVLAAEKYINNNDMLMIANSDQLVNFDVNNYVNDLKDRDLDGSILVFKDKFKDPKWSFAKLTDNNLVEKVAEKDPISDLATVGIYLFKTGKSFVSGAIQMIVANERVNNEFYTCPVYNYLIKEGLKIGVYEVSSGDMNGIGTPDDLDKYLKYNKFMPSKDAPC